MNMMFMLKKKVCFLLTQVDSILDGTTDITRTFILGEISETGKKILHICIKGYVEDAGSLFSYMVQMVSGLMVL